MISFLLPDTKEFMTHLLLADTFDSFSFIEGEIVTFNTFHIDGFIQKKFFDTGENLPEYSSWKYVREYCFSIIRGKRSPLRFHLVFSLSRSNIERLVSQSTHAFPAEDVRGLYLNIRFDGKTLSCVTGTSFRSFTMDKSLEREWDDMVLRFLKQKNIACDFEV